MLVSDRASKASEALKNLPPYPQVVARVTELLAKDPTSFRPIADALAADAALSAEVLRMANSPLMCVRGTVTSIVQALAVLGSRRLTGLMMTLGLSRFVRRAGKSEAMRRLWRHNLACALAARHLAGESGSDSSDAYNAGLFHDVGRLALLVQDAAFYDGALAAGANIDELERDRFGVDHCEAGAWVIEKWRLPNPLVEVTLHHHNPPQDATPLTALVHEACQTADRLGFSLVPVSGEAELKPADELCFSIALAINAWECENGM